MRKKIVNEEIDNGSTTYFSEAENEANVIHQTTDETYLKNMKLLKNEVGQLKLQKR
jgi:hypothetical protein